MMKRLHRSKRDSMISGVCGGIAEYFTVDPSLVRIAWAIFVCAYGTGILAYIIAAIILPSE